MREFFESVGLFFFICLFIGCMTIVTVAMTKTKDKVSEGTPFCISRDAPELLVKDGNIHQQLEPCRN